MQMSGMSGDGSQGDNATGQVPAGAVANNPSGAAIDQVGVPQPHDGVEGEPTNDSHVHQQSSQEGATDGVDSDTTVDSGDDSKPFDVTGFNIEGVSINFQIPNEGVQMVIDAGLNIETLVGEYKEGGLSDESLQALYSKHGKFIIDSMLHSLDANLKGAVQQYNESLSNAFNEVSEAIGGADEWSKMEAFAETLPQDVIENFNAAMASGNAYIQKLAAKDLHAMMSPVESTKPELSLIEGSKVSSGAPTACSALEYRNAIVSGEYYKDPNKWDNLRRAGQAQGL